MKADTAGEATNSRFAFGVSSRARFGFARFDLLALVCFMLTCATLVCFANAAFAQSASGTAPGTLIRNTAVVEFTRPGGGTENVFSNTVAATVEPLPTRADITLLRVTDAQTATLQSSAGPTSCRINNTFVNLAAPIVGGSAPINPLQSIAMTNATAVHGGDAMFVQVVDADQNRDAMAVDTIDLRLTSAIGDSEVIRLSETGSNTGVFVGYIQSRVAAVTSGDCVLQVDRNSQVTFSYADPRDAQDTVSASALVDPFGLVFDSATGQPVNGAVVRIIDVATGLPATVFGDDGVSRYPSTMTTGSQVTDAGGTVYSLPAGVFRFPLVAAGQYRLEVTPPTSHAFPSQRTIAELNTLPGAPYRLQAGSFGNAFAAVAPPAVAIDVPLDPSNAALYLNKTTTTTIASPGDFVQYTLTLQNTGDNGTFQNVALEDFLPAGVRYRKGSARLAMQAIADPVIGADGRHLTFTIPQLAPHARVLVSYVVEITQSARGYQLTNAARAASNNGVVSNDAQATIRLREDLFRDKSILVGRVVEGDCAKQSNELPGVAGVRVYMEDGRYGVTDEEGKYHFEAVNPGNHVVQIDAASIPDGYEIKLCNDNTAHSGRGYSQFVDLRAGAMWRADFYLAKRKPPEGSVALLLTTQQRGELELSHTLSVSVLGVPASKVRAVAMLPSGVEYIAGSAKRDDGSAIEPNNADGVLTFALGDLAAREDSPHQVTFRTRVAQQASGAMALKSYLMFDTPSGEKKLSSPTENRLLRGEVSMEKASYRFSPRFEVLKAELNAADRAQLDKLAAEWRGVRNVKITAIGHTDSTPISDANKSAFKDNYELSRARAQAVADYLREKLGSNPEQLVVDGKGPDEPLEKGKDAASLARNRRVEISLEGVRVQALGKVSVTSARAESDRVATVGVVAGLKASSVEPKKELRSDGFDIEKVAPEVSWLTPQAGAIPAIGSVKVAIAHKVDQKIELLINDKPVSALNFDGVMENKAKTIAVSRWIGIDLQDGKNQLVAIVRDGEGGEVTRMVRDVHFAGGAVRAEWVREQSNLIADGKTKPVIALRMFDAYDKPARPGTQGAFSIEAPYRSWYEVQMQRENPLLAINKRQPTFTVDDDGLARIELEPTTQTGNAMVHLQFNARQTQDLRVWLAPQAREWVLVGIAEGTGAYNTIKDNLQNAQDAGLEEGFEKDGRVAFFAKGRIKGDFLMTIAFDSAREKKTDPLADRRLLGTIEPDAYYTIYGDGSEQRFEAASNEKLYVKIERQQFMAMFGDFQSGFTVTELSRYSRTLTGVKSEYAGERFTLNAFAAQTDQGYYKDELVGDGTSGLYRLSTGSIIANSDKIRIEVRDRFRSEVVVDTQVLTRYVDYNIDYFNGTLFFKQPIPSRDGNFNPVYIIAEYEVLQGGREQLVAGTRAAVKLADDKVEIGASYVQEGSEAGDTKLAGTDVRVKLGEHTMVRGEIARSQSDNPLRAAEANAYFTEIKHVSERVDASAYFREQETGFGFGQQLSTEFGTRKAGIDGRLRIADHWAMRAEAFQQSMLDSNAERQLASAEVRRETERYGLGLGVRHVSDAGLQDGKLQSDLASLNGSVNLFGERVVLKGAYDHSLGASAESIDYPARAMVGLDFKLTQSTTLFSEYEHTDGSQLSSDMTRIGMRSSPWERAQISSSMNQQFTEYGPRTFANVGLTQGWQINDRWAMDFGFDQNKTVRGSELPTQATATRSPFTQLASGSLNEDFYAASIAAMYRGVDWTFTSRAEHRDSDNESRWNYLGGLYREAVKGHAFSLVANYLTSDARARGETTAGLLRASWAYRPIESEWIVFDKLELKRDERVDTLGSIESSRIVNNLHANWLINRRTQMGVQFGARYVQSTFDGERYTGFSDLYGFDLRRDLSTSFDIGLHGALLHSWDAETSETTAGIDLGVTVARNVWISVGYNFVGFDDKDYSTSRYTAQGPFIKLRMKFDQDTFKDLSLDSLRANRARNAN